MFINVLEVKKYMHIINTEKYILYHKDNMQMISILSYMHSLVQKYSNGTKCINRKNDVSLSYTSLINEAVCVSLSDSLHD